MTESGRLAIFSQGEFKVNWIESTTYPHELHCDKLEAFGFESLDDVSNKTALDTIRLDHQEATFCI